MPVQYDPTLVTLSILIAIVASYTALNLAGRVAVNRGRARMAWLLGGSVGMGSGIWSMHFIAMLAFHLPAPIAYDVPLVLLSYLAAVAASALALYVASRPSVGTPRLIGAGVCMGVAIVAMHYTGMAAMRVPAHIRWSVTLVAASVLIAVTASSVALWLFLWLRTDDSRRGRSLRVAAAVVMGLAIAGMHYTGMAAASFLAMHGTPFAPHGFLLEASGLAVPVAGGTFIILALALIGSITDHWVRVQLASAEALRQSEERYRSVMSEISEVIFRTDAEGRWTFLNPAWTQITGFTPEETLGKLLLDSIHPEDRSASVEQCRPLMEGKADYCRHEVRYRTKDGEPRWVEVHARATRNAAGTLIGTAGVIRDITDRRQAEIAQRAARETAEAASRAKSEFLSRMSHELRTPLNAILGFGQLMEMDATTPDQRENTEHILKAGKHLLALINEALDITGIESGRLRLSAEPVDVAEIVKEVLELTRPLAAKHRITLAGDSCPTERYAHADRQRLKQVLLNLVANAIKYNRDAGMVRVECLRSGTDRVRLTVTDTGPGIAPEMLTRLFTPFDRLGAEQTGVEGTGLGLALSKRLVEAMKGEIGVTTMRGAGSTFWVELPEAESQLERLERLDDGDLSPAAVEHRACTILYVEDNLSNLMLMRRLFATRPAVELIPCMQGGLALELARSHRPNLVLLDLHLPDMTGESVLHRLRRSPDCGDIPIIVLSADATQGQIDRLLAAGARAYITKPLDVKSFMTVLDDVLAPKELVC
ncbi:MAG TPA: MHYT domain-containing protein [Gemmatimonadaceae bacterium]|nr:MHYT domain-containing protein [Gemmatimonadaceae bacterium]